MAKFVPRGLGLAPDLPMVAETIRSTPDPER